MLHAIGSEGGSEAPAMTKVLLVLGSHNEVLERSARNLGSPGHQSAAINDVTLTHLFLHAFQSNNAP